MKQQQTNISALIGTLLIITAFASWIFITESFAILCGIAGVILLIVGVAQEQNKKVR
mgnify:CR=1 FL=1